MVKMIQFKFITFIVAILCWLLKQFNVKDAFLHGDLEQEVFMEVLLGLEFSLANGKMCRLKKAFCAKWL